MYKFNGFIYLSIMMILLGCEFGKPNQSNSTVSSLNSNALAKTSHSTRSIFRNNGDLIVDALGEIPVSKEYRKYLFHVSNHSSNNYHLQTLRIGDDKNDYYLSSENLEVIGYACKNLMAHASCSIQLQAKTLTSADQILEMEFKNDKDDITQVNEPIRLSNNTNLMNGFRVDLDDINQVVTTDGDYSMSIPVLLTESFTQIKALNGSLICSGNDFKKGNGCSYLVRGHALMDNTLVALQLTGYQGTTKLDSGVTNILVRVSVQANLILSHGAEIDPQSSDKSTEITVHNTGIANAIITDIQIESPLQIQTNECPTSLAAESSCKIKLKLANYASEQFTLKPSIPLIVKYLSNDQPQQVGTSIYIKPVVTPDAALTFSNIKGGLTNTLLGTETTQTVKIQNSGGVTLNLIKINLSNRVGLSLVFPTRGDGGCSPSSQSLESNESCIFQLKYRYNGGLVTNNVAQVVISGIAKNLPFRTNYITNYSGISDANLLSIDPIANLTVLANSSSIAKSLFTLRNNLPEIPLILNSVSLTSSIPQLTIVAESCKDGVKLDTAMPFCSGLVQYGSPPSSQLASGIQLNAKFKAENSNSIREVKSNKFTAEAKNDYLPLITTKFAIGDDKPLRFSGKGTANEPYDFLALAWRHQLTLIYTFTNEGSAPVRNFKFRNLDKTYIDFTASPNSCGLDDGIELKPGDSCQLTATVASESFLKMRRAIPGVISLKLPVSYSYGDDLNGSYLIEDYDLTRYIQFRRDWLNVIYSYPSVIYPANNAWDLSITGTVDIDSAITDLEGNSNVTLTPIVSHATVTACSVIFPNTNCVAKVSFSQLSHIYGDQIFSMRGLAGWTSHENAVLQTVKVNLSR